jgi:hypothetical protein
MPVCPDFQNQMQRMSKTGLKELKHKGKGFAKFKAADL